MLITIQCQKLSKIIYTETYNSLGAKYWRAKRNENLLIIPFEAEDRVAYCFNW